jgi:membrane-associated phospholipid phosphatase
MRSLPMAKKAKRKTKKKTAKAKLRSRLKAAGPIEQVDLTVGAAATRLGRTKEVKPFAWLAELADEPPLMLGAAVVAGLGFIRRDERQARAGARMLIALGLAIGAAKLGKHLIARTRPRRLVDEGEHKMYVDGPTTDEWNSFPSGHAAAGFAAARALGRDYPAFAPPAISGAISAGLLKVVKGDHFPSDIVAGLLVGYGAEAIAARLVPAMPSASSRIGIQPSTPRIAQA